MGSEGDKPKLDAKQSLERAAKLFQKNSFAKNMVAGTASGVLTGTLVGYAGKGVAMLLGSSIILYEIAHNQGLVSKDLGSLKSFAQEKTNELAKTTPAVNKMRAFATKNKAFTAGFLGGFLLGIAF